MSICSCEWPLLSNCATGDTDGSACSYSVYVLEASASNRLTYFLPPLVSPFSLKQNVLP